MSQHPVDRLIIELVQTKQPATSQETTRIMAHMTQADFNQRIMPIV